MNLNRSRSSSCASLVADSQLAAHSRRIDNRLIVMHTRGANKADSEEAVEVRLTSDYQEHSSSNL